MADGKKLAELKLGASLNRLGISGRGRSPSGSGLTRLGSLKPARDLTLGSTPKRNFVPNIPARRTVKEEPSNDKPEATASSQQGDGKRNRGGTPRRGRDRGRGRGRGRGEIVMSQSIFSQGPFALNRPGASRESTSSYSSQGNRESCHGEPRSRSSVIREGKGGLESGEDSQRILDMLSNSGKMEIDDEEIQRGGLMPITIPLANPKLLGDQLKEIKVDPRQHTVKEEDIDISSLGLKPKMIEKFTHQVTCHQLFSSNFEKEQLLFLQFPDALPIKPLSHESDVHNEGEAAEKVDTHQASDENLQKFSFTNVSEGYIGKLVVHKSGRVRMLLGNASFDVDMGTPCGFLQDLVAIHLDNNRKEMVCLGHVNQRILCVPDFDELVGSAAS